MWNEFQGFETVPPSSLVTDAALQALEDFLNGGGGGRIEIGHKKDVINLKFYFYNL